MKHIIAFWMILCLTTACLPAWAEDALPQLGGEGENIMDVAKLAEERAAAWEAYVERMLSDSTLLQETEAHEMAFGDVTMRYFVDVIGNKPENGYPLYIALHGGGGSDTPDLNDSQWEAMQDYYRYALRCGVYVAPRGVRDTWDTHFNPESYPLYDRLIQYMILTQDVDPNRVYLEGFSAGGDGVYAVAPRMADRFAAANMSSGHPNGVSMINMKNLPIQLQAGEFDTDYNRHTVTAEYDGYLNDLQAQYGGYEHRTLIHYNSGHNYRDYDTKSIGCMNDPQKWLKEGDRSFGMVDSFPPDYMKQFTRDPLPQEVIWDLATRADMRQVGSFYYLSAPQETKEGLIQASYDRETNRVTISTEGVGGEFSILLNEQMVDFEKPVVFSVNGAEIAVQVNPDRAVLEKTTAERGDPNYQFEAEIPYAELEKLIQK